MKIKRLIASGAAAVAGITILLGSALGAVTFGDGMGTFFEKTDSTYKSPLVVVGDTAGIVDVIGATDIAASFVSNYAVNTLEVPAAGSSMTVTSGGTDLATTATKIYIGDVISTAKQVLTAEDLPAILAPGTFEDDDNNDYNYEQYIYLGTNAARNVKFGTSGEDIDPDLYLDVGTDATTNYFYSTKLVFDTAVNFSNADVHGNDINIFGSKYTVAATSTNAKIVLFGSAAKETINAGETKTVTFGGTDYTIEVLGIQSSTLAIVKVSGETEEITEGEEETVAGLTFYVDTITKWDAQTGEGYAGYVQLSLGSQKMIFEDGEAIALGEDEEEVDGTEVDLTGTAEVSVIEVKVAAEDTDYEYILPGGAFEDPVWGTFQTEFNGMAPAADSTNREDIELSSSGKYAKVKLTTKKGDTDEVEFGYSATTTVNLMSNKKKIHVVEGAAVAEDEYVMVDAGGFPHMFLVDNVKKAGSSAGEVKLKDVFSGATIEAVLAAGGDNSVDKVIDGQTYYLNVSTLDEKVRITWNFNGSDTAADGDPGAYQTIFPALITGKGAYVALAENVTGTTDEVGLGSTTMVVVPGGFICAAAGCNAGGVIYNVNLTGTGAVDIVGADEATVIVIEEEDADDAQNSVLVTTYYDTTDETIFVEPILSAGTSDESNAFVTLETDDDYEQLMDTYGTIVTWNEQDDNSAVISYPNDQAIVGIGVGSDPSFAVGGGVGGTYNAAIPVTNPIAKFASEITATSSLDKNLVLVGGPCVNSIVKTLLDEAWNTTDSCNYWLNTHETLKNSGNGMLKIVEDVFGSGKKALIVAGTQGADTRNLIANKVIKPTVYDAMSGYEYIGAV